MNGFKVTVEHLNEIARRIGTNDKIVVISTCIKALKMAGFSDEAALDAVFGKEFLADFFGELYHQLRGELVVS